jgi:hypothetical protein
MAGLDIFKAKLKGGGARPNLFKVNLPFPASTGGSSEQASFMIKAATLPASVIAAIPIPFRGRKLNVAGDRTFEPWTITVLNDTSMDVRNAFERWMNLINANADNVSAYVGNNSLNYYTDILVHQLDRDDSITKTYEIIGAFPTNISAIDLSYETNDVVEEFTVELTYQYWTSERSGIS